MAAHDKYPTLSQLLGELRQLDEAGHLNKGASRVQGGGKLRFTRGLALGRFSWPGVGDFWLTRVQQDVVAVLLEAYFESKVPDVRQAVVLTAIKSGKARLAEVFEGTEGAEAWGRLILPGKTPGTYRLATPSGDGGVADDDGDEEGETADEWIE